MSCSLFRGAFPGRDVVELDGTSVEGTAVETDDVEDVAISVVNRPDLKAALSCPDFKSKTSEPLL